MKLELGISITSFYPHTPPREAGQRMVERAAAAQRARLSSLFVGDHHATPHPYLQNSVILGRLLAEWGDRPFGALYLLPLWHPVLLAEQTGTLASLCDGDFVLQCAIGPDDHQFPAMGVNPRHRPSRFEECLDAVRRLWAGDTVSADGRYQFTDAKISPCPASMPQVWIGAQAEPAIDRAARLGDGWIASPSLTVDEAVVQLESYRTAEARHNRPAGKATIRRDFYIGSSHDEAVRTTRDVVERGYRGFPERALLIGDVDHVAAELERMAAAGFEHVLFRNLVSEQEAAVASIERIEGVRRTLGIQVPGEA